MISNSQFDVLKNLPRKETYYTQGLLFDKDNNLIESGGLYRESVLVKLEYPSLKILKKINLKNEFFAEGIGICNDEYLYQLTWKERKILKYSLPDLELVEMINMDNTLKSGWGLTNYNTNNLIATDGSNSIYILDCNNNLQVKKSISVFNDNSQLDRLNALVYVDGYIYANRYYDSNIYKINPESGIVEKTYDFGVLIQKEKEIGTLTNDKISSGLVLNGILYDKKRKIFILTGKKWDNYYEVILK